MPRKKRIQGSLEQECKRLPGKRVPLMVLEEHVKKIKEVCEQLGIDHLYQVDSAFINHFAGGAERNTFRTFERHLEAAKALVSKN